MLLETQRTALRQFRSAFRSKRGRPWFSRGLAIRLLKKGFDAYRGQEARLLMAEYLAFLPNLPIAISALSSLASKKASPGFVRSTV